MAFIQTLKRKAIDDGKLFKSTNKKVSLKIPKEQCGFKMSYIPVPNLKCQVDVDMRAVVSLALVNKKSTLLEAYANKLPIMTISVPRLLYTIEAFSLRDKTSDTSSEQQALEFYIKTDLKHRDKSLEPNHQFSQFLHRLKSNGYREYIFDLAKEINLNVDYIMDAKVAARYIKTEGEPNKQYSSSIGFITAIHESNSNWYVKTTITPILV